MAQFLTRVLCIDDDRLLLDAARAVLSETARYDVVQFTDVDEALKCLDRQLPDIILLDVMMPEISGIDAFHQIRARAHLAKVPIIFMTARKEPAEIEHYQNLGGTAVITKPFDPLDLPYQLEFILGKLSASE